MQKKIHLANLLAPVAYAEHMKSPIGYLATLPFELKVGWGVIWTLGTVHITLFLALFCSFDILQRCKLNQPSMKLNKYRLDIVSPATRATTPAL